MGGLAGPSADRVVQLQTPWPHENPPVQLRGTCSRMILSNLVRAIRSDGSSAGSLMKWRSVAFSFPPDHRARRLSTGLEPLAEAFTFQDSET